MSALVRCLQAEIAERGPLTFARFMERVLYDPDGGYYMTGIRTGRSGDYLTAPEVHPIFGWTLAGQIVECWELLDRPAPFTLIEFGPGPGTLILSILEELERAAPELLSSLRYHPLERSSLAREELVRRLSGAGYEHLLAWELDRPVTAVVLANEVLDALPVHRVRCRDGELEELYVGWDGERLVEVPGSLSSPALGAWLERLGVRLVEGQVTELCLAMEGWLDEVAQLLHCGYVVVLDYGYPVPERYDPTRFPGGTIRTYAAHTVGDDPLVAPGEQDITAHVDFTMLQHAAADRGFVPLGLVTQAEFLTQAGLGERLVALQAVPGMTAERYLAARAAAFHLLDPGGLGRFRVLLLGKQVRTDAVPSGWRPRLVTGTPLPGEGH